MSIANLSDDELAAALGKSSDSRTDPAYGTLVDEFMARHASWLKGRCGQLSRHYWQGDTEFAEEVFARFSEKVARRALFAGLREPEKWRGFLAAELEHHAQDLGRFLRAARRDRRTDAGTVREVPLDDHGAEAVDLAAPAPIDALVSEENISAVREAIRTLAHAAARRGRTKSTRDLYNLQMFVRVILQGRSRKDLALEQMDVAGRRPESSGITLDGARKKVERAVIAGVTAIAAALESRGYTELAQAFRGYLRVQSEMRGRSARSATTVEVSREAP